MITRLMQEVLLSFIRSSIEVVVEFVASAFLNSPKNYLFFFLFFFCYLFHSNTVLFPALLLHIFVILYCLCLPVMLFFIVSFGNKLPSIFISLRAKTVAVFFFVFLSVYLFNLNKFCSVYKAACKVYRETLFFFFFIYYFTIFDFILLFFLFCFVVVIYCFAKQFL